MPQLRSVNYVNHLGQPISVAATKKVTQKKAPSPDGFHKGWRVVGHKPGQLEEARALAIAESETRDEMSESDRAAAIAGGARKPKPWDEGNWRRTAKKYPVRAKPYEIPDAAEQCRALAEKSGWLDVEINEIKCEAAIQ